MINGNMLRLGMISGANNISNHRKIVDELNVFPVPDGDTGTNMSMTMQAASSQLLAVNERESAGEVSKIAASALLRGARGNSGVILSLLFRGLSKGMVDKTDIAAKDLVVALEQGVEAAYGAVMKPTEGTMLTVARVAAEEARKALPKVDNAVAMWDIIIVAARASLKTTPDLLPALKKAGVVDAGGEGVCLIFEGMQRVFQGEEIIALSDSNQRKTSDVQKVMSAAGSATDVDIEFAYCTEFIINRENDTDATKLRAYLTTLGDSLVLVEDDDIIKIHVHTNDPGSALQSAQKYGNLTSIKIDNMREQHSHKVIEVKQSEKFEDYAKVDKETEYGFVTVSAGEGLKSLFLDLGVNVVVNGGQTMNPSTDDILNAIHSVPAKNVIVLPNNKNIVMSAEQAQSLADRNVIVPTTTSIPQGIAAMLAYDENLEPLELQSAMQEAANNVNTGQLTFAARDSEFEGKKINKGEILALADGKISFVDSDLNKATVKLIRDLISKRNDTSFVTVMYGEDIDEYSAENIKEMIENKINKDIEVLMVNGGQPIYYYIISVE